jgi:serine/threonine protein kinase/WD40 repeat protein
MRAECPHCLRSFTPRASPAASETDATTAADAGDLATLVRPTPGRILGERYEIRERLGRGGMGEVFRAFDLKLRVDVALKALRAGRVGSQQALEQLRGEVRAAREVVSPNVCRIFDLVEEDGQEFVSMEYIDGGTLAEALRERGPLAVQEAHEIASQFLSGLEAIHQAGLVHRDFKPENVMITRAGRVVVMDFGLAKARTEGPAGTISGTPAYMAPEQARGEGVDARADVFAAGIVLSEMLTLGPGSPADSRPSLWRGVRESPPRVPDGPWAPVLRQALSPNRDERPTSARALARALDEVTERLPGFDTRRPYPGLSSFTEADSDYFFGREAELEEVWRKLGRSRLLALIAPSGAGKSSFLRAGLVPSLPEGWKALVVTPGARPFQSLARSLVPFFSGDTPATQALVQLEDEDTAVSLLQRWRRRHAHALVILDQFEELFTLTPGPVREAFARVLGRLVLEADIHVLLSLRDDFLFRCREHEALRPAFSDLTALGPLDESALRRALVQPALVCGYRFEDEALIDEMLAELQKERGALPLLAFAASRLWEKRDRERGLLTRAAYAEIGGVAGALAQHAEATLARVGTQRTPIVRELFRNLVTAEDTRAVRQREELLSVFSGGATTSAEAEAVLAALVDARLLTSYEQPGEAGTTRQSIEIVHESLLWAWPRLVRWQTQDKDGAQLRDQLRQAAQLWLDRGQTTDLLWSGQAYRDLALWRERYTVPLSASEESFARATEANAMRRRRRRRAVAAMLMGATATVAIVTSILWQRADASRRAAEAEARRAEASKLLALGQLELDRYPTAALAYALKSLELDDAASGRQFALRALQRGPVARLTPSLSDDSGAITPPAFSANGEWLAFGGWRRVELFRREGGAALVLGGDYAEERALVAGFGPASDTLVSNRDGEVRVWSLPEGRELRRQAFEQGVSVLWMGRDVFLTATQVGERWILRQHALAVADARVIGAFEARDFGLSPERRVMAIVRGRSIHERSLDRWAAPVRLLAEHQAEVEAVVYSPDGLRLAARDRSGEIRIWPTDERGLRPLRVLSGGDGLGRLRLDQKGRWLAGIGGQRGLASVRLWDLTAPPGAEPIVLRRADAPYWNSLAFDPSGAWLATSNSGDGTLWSLGGTHPHVLAAHDLFVWSMAFTPDGKRIVSASQDGTVRSWPISAEVGGESRVLVRDDLFFPELAIDEHQIVVSPGRGRLQVVPVDGGAVRELGRVYPEEGGGGPLAHFGNLVAIAPAGGAPNDRVIRIIDLHSGTVRVLPPVPGVIDTAGAGFGWLQFVSGDRLLAAKLGAGLLLYDLDRAEGRLLTTQVQWRSTVSPDGSVGMGVALFPEFTLLGRTSELVRFYLDGRQPRALGAHGTAVSAVAVSPDAALVASGSVDGTVRIGPVSGEEPHVFFGHEGVVWTMAFSQDGRWLASGGNDGTVRLWPVPDLSGKPPQVWERARFLALFRAKTNVRVVSDPRSATGWKLDREAFPGWQDEANP